MGEFLEMFRTLGFKIEGCELSPECMEFIRRKNLPGNFFHGYFEDLDLQRNYYSVVILSSIIEHFQNPALALKKAYEIMSPGGLCIVLGANFDSWERRKNGPAWMGFTAGHFYFFSPATIRRVLEKTGFEKVKFSHPDQQDLFTLKMINLPYAVRRAYLCLTRGRLIRRSAKFFAYARKPV